MSICRWRAKRSALISVIALLIMVTPTGAPIGAPAAAQGEQAAVARVLYAGVEVRRVNTVAWLPLPVDAQFAVGAGDSLRTGEGRVLLLFDDVEVLLLPASLLTIDTFTADQLALTAEGRLVQRGSAPADYRLHADNALITQAAQHFTLDAATDMITVTVAQGSAVINEMTLNAGSGMRIEGDRARELAFDPPWNAAALDAALNGCPGVINTEGGVELRLRQGPGTGFSFLIARPNGSAVSLLGVNASSGWVRVQFLSGYGWMQRLAVQTTCSEADLPSYADTTRELDAPIYNPSPEEIALLAPFYGTPRSNPLLFRLR